MLQKSVTINLVSKLVGKLHQQLPETCKEVTQ